MTRKIALLFAGALNLSEEQVEVFHYGLLLLKSTLLSLGAVLLAGFLVGNVLGTLLLSLVVAALRVFQGGVHCASEYRCAVTSAIVFGGLGFVLLRLPGWLELELVIFGAILLIVFATYLWAPLPSPEKPIRKPEHRRKFRFLSYGAITVFTAVMLWCYYLNHISIALAIAAGFLWQSLLLSPAGSGLIHGFDWVLSRLSPLKTGRV